MRNTRHKNTNGPQKKYLIGTVKTIFGLYLWPIKTGFTFKKIFTCQTSNFRRYVVCHHSNHSYTFHLFLHHMCQLLHMRIYLHLYCQPNLNMRKTCLKQPLKNSQNKVLKTNCSLMKVESIVECSLGAFCNAFDLH